MLERLPSPNRALRLAARRIAQDAFARGAELDADDAFPDVELEALHRSGLLAAPLRSEHGGVGLGVDEASAELTLDVLASIGWGSLPLGRIYEGHVNALKLIQTYGNERQIARLADDVRAGMTFGVWNTDGADGLRLVEGSDGSTLQGGKIFASGAGRIARPLVTARAADGAPRLVAPRDCASARADASAWRAHGMRASASGAYDFTGLAVSHDDIIGGPDDYHRQPAFSAGAWRFCAVQLGGIERLLDLVRDHLVRMKRDSDPHQLSRVGRAAIATQSARLWVAAAATRAEAARPADAESLIAFVNLTRLAVERAGLDVIELAQSCVGLAGFQRAHPMERAMRDLATYLRQPAPDKALTDAARHVLARTEHAADLWARDES